MEVITGQASQTDFTESHVKQNRLYSVVASCSREKVHILVLLESSMQTQFVLKQKKKKRGYGTSRNELDYYF